MKLHGHGNIDFKQYDLLNAVISHTWETSYKETKPKKQGKPMDFETMCACLHLTYNEFGEPEPIHVGSFWCYLFAGALKAIQQCQLEFALEIMELAVKARHRGLYDTELEDIKNEMEGYRKIFSNYIKIQESTK